MATAADTTIIPFPTKRRAPFPSPGAIPGQPLPENVVRFERPWVWALIPADLHDLLKAQRTS